MRSNKHSIFRFFSFDHRLGFSRVVQCLGIFFLIVLSVFIGILDLRSTGLHFGYAFSPSIFFAPLYEEFLFRGLLLGFLATHTSALRVVFLSSVLFGLWHFKNVLWMPIQPVLTQVVYATILGLVFSVITLRQQSLVPAIFLHYINNIVAESLRIL